MVTVPRSNVRGRAWSKVQRLAGLLGLLGLALGVPGLAGLAGCQSSKLQPMPPGPGVPGPDSVGGPGSDGTKVGLPDGGAGDAAATNPRPPASGEQCAEEAITGEMVPLDLMLVLDASGSMKVMVGGKTRWTQVTD